MIVAECLCMRHQILQHCLSVCMYVCMYVCYSYIIALSGLQVYTSDSVYVDHEGKAQVVYVN